MSYDFYEDLEEQLKRDKRVLICGIIIFSLAISYIFIGCANPKLGQKKEYIENEHLYIEVVGAEKRMIKKIRGVEGLR